MELPTFTLIFTVLIHPHLLQRGHQDAVINRIYASSYRGIRKLSHSLCQIQAAHDLHGQE